MTAARLLLALAGALLAWALFFGGGDSPDRLAWIGGAALLTAALLAAASLMRWLARPRLGRVAAASVACFAALVVWQGISLTWSVQPDRSWDSFNRGMVYLAFLAVGAFVGALVPRATRAAAVGLAALVALVLAYALLAKGIPALYPEYGRLARLRSPIGYWNALALLADFALVLGLWRAAQRRLDGLLLVFGATVSLLLAYSRGGVIIAAIVVAAWLALDRRRLDSLVALALGGGAGVAVFGIALALHGVTDDGQPRAVRVHDGWLFLLTLAVAGAVAAALGRLALRLEPSAAARRRATVVLFAAITLTGVVGTAAAALHAGGSATTAPGAGTQCTQGPSRLACGSSDARLDWWKEAWQSFEDEPLHGTGAGSFERAHRLHRTQGTLPVTEPHNLALQALGETGAVGFVLFLGTVAFAALAVRRRLRDDAAVALAVCALAYLAHVLIDIGYDYVAVSAPFFTLLGVLLAEAKTPVARREPVWAGGAMLLGAAAVLSLAAPYIAQRKLDEAVRREDPQLAAEAHDWNPVSVAPLLTEAVLEESQGHRTKALRLYHDAVDTQPEDPDAWAELGLFELYTMKDACGAYRSLDQAYELDRFNPLVATKGGPLDVARTKARAQRCG